MTAPAEESAKLRRTSPAEWAVGLLGLLALLARFVRLDLAPFILDEPAFVMTARDQLLTHHWALASPLEGTQGWTYGPSVLWFDGLVQWLLSPRPEACILGLCVLMTLAHAALAAGVAQVFRGGVLLFGLTAGLLAASPYQYFWARLAWDPIVNVCVAGAVFLFANPGVLKPWRAAVLGAVLGVGVSSHLMIGPFVAALLAVLLVTHRRHLDAQRLGGAAVLFGTAVAVNIPYLRFLREHPPHAVAALPGSFWPALGSELLQPLRTASVWGMDYFFDGEWNLFQRWFGPSTLWALSVAGLVLLGGLAVLGLAAGLRMQGRPRHLAVLAVLTWVGYAVFYASRSLPLHPHYTFPSYWVVVTGVAGALTWARHRAGVWRASVPGAVALLCAFQLLFIWKWMHYVDERGGTRGIHYSVPVALQRAAVQRVCAEAAPVLLSNETRLFPLSLVALASSEPSCAGRHIQLCDPGRCPPPGSPAASGKRLLHLRYLPDSAHLTLEW